jgi:hypothetical protein
MHNNSDVVPWPSRVPPGVPGAGWLIATVFAFSVVVLSSWWWEGSHGAMAAPASHHTSGANGASR